MDHRPGQRLHAALRDLSRTRSARTAAERATVALAALADTERSIVDARDEAIARLRGQGWTLQDIGDLTGLTRGRVHQILTERRAAVGQPEQPRARRRAAG